MLTVKGGFFSLFLKENFFFLPRDETASFLYFGDFWHLFLFPPRRLAPPTHDGGVQFLEMISAPSRAFFSGQLIKPI